MGGFIYAHNSELLRSRAMTWEHVDTHDNTEDDRFNELFVSKVQSGITFSKISKFNDKSGNGLEKIRYLGINVNLTKSRWFESTQGIWLILNSVI